MRKVKQLKGWGIFENNPREVEEYGFSHTVIHPDNMEYSYMLTPADSDVECDSFLFAVAWINNY